MKPDICIYHAPCADGFGAAWAVWKKFPDIVFHPGVHGEPPPDVAGKNVVLVDFSYKRDVLVNMLRSGDARQAMTILILDHHKTAQEDLAGICEPEDGVYAPDQWRAKWEQEVEWPGRAVFDMARSGAQIAWDFFHPGEPRPKLIDYVADRDLWKFDLPHSRAVASWVFSYPYRFVTWEEMARQIESPMYFRGVVDQGTAIERKHQKDIKELVAQTRRIMVIGGQSVPVANLPYTYASDAAGEMAATAPFAACYFDRADGQRVFSLRSRGINGADVSAIAAGYGGGGHKNAAGFQMPLGWKGDKS